MSRIPAAHMGSIRIMDFNSSTRWTVASLHKLGCFESVASASVTTAALSNHLQHSYRRACSSLNIQLIRYSKTPSYE